MVLHWLSSLLKFATGSILGLLLPLGSNLSLASLLSALVIAATYLLLTRRSGKRQVKYKVLLRALFPKWLRRPSFKADVGFLLFNVLIYSALFGWAVISSGFISSQLDAGLTAFFGGVSGTGLNNFASRTIATVCLFLTYELAFWVDHYLSHRIPWLWEFHKVHHTAEVLSPITNFRVHPVDTVVFFNISALFFGLTGGVLSYLHLGQAFAIDGANVLLVMFFFSTVHLQHSHVWIPITGPLGRVIFSPAHHQIHHSDNPIHYDKNFGSCLALWDWLFGTLWMPAPKRERLNFGIAERSRSHHTAIGGFVMPFVLAWSRVWPTKIGAAPEPTRQTLPQ